MKSLRLPIEASSIEEATEIFERYLDVRDYSVVGEVKINLSDNRFEFVTQVDHPDYETK